MKNQPNKELRWVLRGLSGLIIAFALFMFIGETYFGEKAPEPLRANEILQLSITGMGLIGLVIAWKWELMGGMISLLAFIVLAIINPIILIPSPLYMWPVTAILFIMLWAMNRKLIK